MVFYQLSEKAKLRRQRTNEAIALAMQSQWDEAIAVNKSIIEIFPDDADAYNRLGKALTQLGRYAEARDAYSHALEIEPNNGIAKKNIDRLAHLREAEAEPRNGRQVSSHLFIEETGKADVADLYRLAPRKVLVKIAAGDPVHLEAKGQSLTVESVDGEYIGEVEPRLGLRLIKLVQGGNRYTAAIVGVGEKGGKVMIKEVFQHPSQAGRPSFPARAADGFRPYVKDSMMKYEREDDEEGLEEEYPGEFENKEPAREEVTSLEEMVAIEDEEEEERSLGLGE
ncbi:MAG: tetratricopeptide repeat protein [Dehalococcoidia bacterium]|nr:tetratricopeptide repeat protein [Dehalococcoidia bacterium]